MFFDYESLTLEIGYVRSTIMSLCTQQNHHLRVTFNKENHRFRFTSRNLSIFYDIFILQVWDCVQTT